MSWQTPDSELAELLQRALVDQDREAFDRLFGSQAGRLEVLLRARLPRVLRARVDVEDIMQETYVRAFQRFRRIPDVTPEVFRRWIVHIALRELKRAFERNAGTQKRDVVLERHVESASHFPKSPGGTPSSFVGRLESAGILAEVLEALPRDYKEVILLRDFEGQPAAAIAERLRRSPGAVDVLYHRALVRLSTLLTERGLSASRY
ncbi:MAG: RNA polymerase sigma factor [Phycisphaerae bacterium]|nr:RNA polymerase sigma factor [Phycisphaerae bacterium]